MGLDLGQKGPSSGPLKHQVGVVEASVGVVSPAMGEASDLEAGTFDQPVSEDFTEAWGQPGGGLDAVLGRNGTPTNWQGVRNGKLRWGIGKRLIICITKDSLLLSGRRRLRTPTNWSRYRLSSLFAKSSDAGERMASRWVGKKVVRGWVLEKPSFTRVQPIRRRGCRPDDGRGTNRRGGGCA